MSKSLYDGRSITNHALDASNANLAIILQACSAPWGFGRISLKAPGDLCFIEAMIDDTAPDITTIAATSETDAVRSDATPRRMTIDFPCPIHSREFGALRSVTAIFY